MTDGRQRVRLLVTSEQKERDNSTTISSHHWNLRGIDQGDLDFQSHELLCKSGGKNGQFFVLFREIQEMHRQRYVDINLSSTVS